MARIEWVDKRLRAWAQWLVVGDASGYASMSTLHEDWSPPTPGMTPTLKVVSHDDGPQTHRAVLQLSERLQHTLQLRYCTQMSLADCAQRLECQPATVDQRIWVAHAQLAATLGKEF